MRGKLWFIGGLAAGFVLGARAGREKYDELVIRGRKMLDHPTVQEAAGVAQAQATRLYAEGRDRLSHTRLGEKLRVGGGNGSTPGLPSTDDTLAGAGASKPAASPSPPSAARGKSTGTGANGSPI